MKKGKIINLIFRISFIMFCANVHAQDKFMKGKRFGKTMKQTPGIVSYTFRNSFKKNVPATLDTIKGFGVFCFIQILCKAYKKYDKAAAEAGSKARQIIGRGWT